MTPKGMGGGMGGISPNHFWLRCVHLVRGSIKPKYTDQEARRGHLPCNQNVVWSRLSKWKHPLHVLQWLNLDYPDMHIWAKAFIRQVWCWTFWEYCCLIFKTPVQGRAPEAVSDSVTLSHTKGRVQTQLDLIFKACPFSITPGFL